MRVLGSAALYLLLTLTVWAEGYVPERRAVLSRDVDFFGSDLTAIFNTSLEACERACLASNECAAFTFNARSNACFPKSAISDQHPYEGAISAEILETPPAVLRAAQLRASELSFLDLNDLEAAEEIARDLSKRHSAQGWLYDDLIVAVRSARSNGNLLSALRLTGAAITLRDSADLWADYGRIAIALRTDNSSQRRDFLNRGLLAAVNAYLRSENDAQRSSILADMASALEANNRGRDMIPALRLAQRFAPRDDVEANLADAVAKYGFRVVETTVDNDAARPRICAVFSERLSQIGVEYDPYVQRPVEGLTVDVSDRQLCIDGVQHGERYRIVLRQGLPSESGEELFKPITIIQYVRDRAPSVRFPGRAYVLPKAGDIALPIETVNTDKVALRLRRVSDRNLLRAIQDDYFGRPLSPWQEGVFANDIAEDVWEGSGDVQNELNKDMITRLPMADVIGELPTGIYALQASVPGLDVYEVAPATQWFVVSDIGLATMSGADGLHVFTRSLASANAMKGLAVTLLSRSNAVLATTTTDAMGHAHFAPGLTRGNRGSAPALVTVEGNQDIAFLSLTEPAFDLSDRGVEGRRAAGPVDVFLSADRGAYRAGETIHLTALARDGNANAIDGLPITAVLFRPDGVEYARKFSQSVGAGGHVLSFSLGETVPRGTWRLALHVDPDAPPVSSATVLVEDFLPERIDFDLALPTGRLSTADQPTLTVEAKYLFGPPAANLPIEGEVVLRATSGIGGFLGYVFGRYDEPLATVTDILSPGKRTGSDGFAAFPVTFPDAGVADRPLEARITVRISEGSGRPVERQITRNLTPSGAMIGIRPEFKDAVPEGGDASFSLIALDRDLQPTEMKVRWTINRIERRYQWYQLFGNWNWDPVTIRSRIATSETALGADPVTVSAPTEWGGYEIVVERLDGPYVASSTEFYSGWFAPTDASATPDTLEASLDKEAYRPGETARLRIAPRYDGTALITVMSNRLIEMKVVPVNGETVVDLPVTDEWGAGVYVSATLIRPMDVPAGRNPARALALRHATVDPGDKALDLTIDVPAAVAPRGPLDLTLNLSGVDAGEAAWATVAAVDLGILNLTAFQSPDPGGYYFGQRKLGVELRDIYGRLIDGLNGAAGQVRSGGDAGPAAGLKSPPPTEKLVAFFSGPVEIGPTGTAQVKFDLPEFNGTVRLMAVAWSPSGVGQAEADVLVRDPVVVTASLPRFLAPGDQSRMLLEIVHASGPAGRIGLDVSVQGLAIGAGEVPTGLTLGDGEKRVLSIPLGADEVGSGEVRIALTTPDGQLLVKTLNLPVVVNDPEVTVTSQFNLADGDTFTFSRDVFAEFRPGTGSATLALGSFARLDVPGLLNALDRYPYGCTEQVTSQALPLLYFDEVAQAMGLSARQEIAQRVDQAIERVLTNQSSNGAFGLWSSGSGDFWLDAYVSDFLSRAKSLGYSVPDQAFRMAMDNLRNRVNFAPDFDAGGEDIAYALMVLAREGAASMGDLRYYADVKGEDFATPLAAAQLGAALASYGDPTRADQMFGIAIRKLSDLGSDNEAPLWRADYGTNLRDAAGVLTLAAEAGSDAVDRTVLTDRLSRAGRRTTQEAIWTLLAANALIDRTGQDGFTIDGAPATGPLVRVLEDQTDIRPIDIGNFTGSDAVLTLTAFGVPEAVSEKGGRGYSIDRLYFTFQGDAVNLDAVPVGTRLVTVLRITPFQRSEARLMVNDPLPAGFEIDNPALLQSGDVRSLDWLQLDAQAQTTEFRSDRFLAAVDWRSDQGFDLAYVVRAISPGNYHHPAASVEDMYRPDYRANTATGRLSVTE